jgi:hypothetical protein
VDDDPDGFTQAAFGFCPCGHAHCFPDSRKHRLRGGRTFSLREARMPVRVKKMVLILMLRANSGANRKLALARLLTLRRFRRLLQRAQSSVV